MNKIERWDRSRLVDVTPSTKDLLTPKIPRACIPAQETRKNGVYSLYLAVDI